MDKPDILPRDAQSILELAARSMFELFASASEGMMLVDRQARVVWINDQYKRFLPALGFEREEDFVGHPVSQVVHNTQMHQVLESGKPILIDLLTNRAGTFVVSRIPLRDSEGQVIGALGIVLFDHPETTLQPLIEKFALLQRDLDDARRELASQRLQSTGQRQSKYTFASFVGQSPAAVEVKRQARRAAQSSSPVLLLGETGTGKELLAHAIHAASARAKGAFISVNIAAVPESLLEAEFFGYVPGAFTGADRKGRDGKFRLASGGTLFLDEIGDMPQALQSKLLRALQEGEIEPLGSNKLLPINVRVIAATSRDLAGLVRAGTFREDLFYRLNVLPIRVPPLRERRADIAALLEVLGEDVALRSGLPSPELSPQALALLEAQAWRGNIRELCNVLEQAAMRSESHRIEVQDIETVLRESGLPPLAATVPQADQATPDAGDAPSDTDGLLRPLAEQVAELETRAIQAALSAHKGNKVAAAKALGIARATLYGRL
ncbi:sigma-54 interaction domain-containing protein [Rhodoferax saidenbachensis]|uniref:Sigma-54-dependent Fis family transcriptional regulator n=1 Tax=Rhodoferax saidenbachensis TaxID=1484693 RepID=A0A1P8KB27_9BURK|nr:sigma 54-interacting transcriptional regulator [Rhodoferax saidenbachensis]APW43203.1 sigma-54-dependent Fis family transcriptional regulator [Rhodoferax saidenbachensis]